MTNRRDLLAIRTVLCLVGLAGACAMAAEKERNSDMPLHLLSDTIVDQAALNFKDGPFGTCINGQTYQQEAVLTHQGYQYAAYFAEGGALSVGRRQLPDGPWQTIRFADYAIHHNDTHNVVSLGLCAGDGTLHLSFDHHTHPLRYRRSVPRLASQPEAFEWTADLFAKTRSDLDGPTIEQVTYPMFFSTPQGKLQFLYRIGVWGNGDWHLAEYDGDTGQWTRLGMLFSRAGNYLTSRSRCAYPNPVRYGADGRLHITWCWRERPANKMTGLRTNHDVCYAWSDDFGRTWKNNAGSTIALLGADEKTKNRPITISSPGAVVRLTRYLWGQMNVTTQFVDTKNRVHVVNWQNPQEAEGDSADLDPWRYYHYWRNTDGAWQEYRLPFVGRKPQIVLDPAGRAFIIHGRAENRNYHGDDPGWTLTIAMAAEETRWTNWRTVWTAPGLFVGEPLIDPVRWQKDGILSIYAQTKPETAGAPSALRVLDLAVKD